MRATMGTCSPPHWIVSPGLAETWQQPKRWWAHHFHSILTYVAPQLFCPFCNWAGPQFRICKWLLQRLGSSQCPLCTRCWTVGRWGWCDKGKEREPPKCQIGGPDIRSWEHAAGSCIHLQTYSFIWKVCSHLVLTAWPPISPKQGWENGGGRGRGRSPSPASVPAHSFPASRTRQNKNNLMHWWLLRIKSQPTCQLIFKNVRNGSQTNKPTRSSMSQQAWRGYSLSVWRKNCTVTKLFLSMGESPMDHLFLVGHAQAKAQGWSG